MNQIRPVNLDLASLKYPPSAIISILHRISGIILFFLLPLVIYIFDVSVRSSHVSDVLHRLHQNPYFNLAIWAFGSALIFHVLAGVRHILMDCGWGEHLATARKSAIAILAVAIVLVIFLGFLIW